MGQRILCIGGAHIDRIMRGKEPLHLGSSNPVTGKTAFGGVARNIAEVLAHLKVETGLVSLLGDDPEGTALLEHAVSLGIDISLVQREPNDLTGSYTAALEPNGELLIGLAHTGIYQKMTPEFFEPLLPRMSEWSHWLVCTNLNHDTLAYLAVQKPASVEMSCSMVSVPYAPRVRGIIPSVTNWFGNQEELAAVFGEHLVAPDSYSLFAQRLRTVGVKRVFVSLGKEGLYVDADEHLGLFEAPQSKIFQVNGAGDGLAAGILAGLTQGMSFHQAIDQGLYAAKAIIESHADNVFDISHIDLKKSA